jgi:hypothetical protein
METKECKCAGFVLPENCGEIDCSKCPYNLSDLIAADESVESFFLNEFDS